MDDQKRDDMLSAADETELRDKAADGELSDDEMSEATGGRRIVVSKTLDEDAEPDGRFRIG